GAAFHEARPRSFEGVAKTLAVMSACGTSATSRGAPSCPLPGLKRSCRKRRLRSEADSKQTLRALGCGRASAARREGRGRGGRTSVVKKVYFDRAGLCEALLSWHSNHAPVTFSAIARSEQIAALAGLTRIRIKIGAGIYTIPLMVRRSLGVRLYVARKDC